MFFVLLSVFHLLVFNENRNYKNAIILGISTGIIANAHSIGMLNVAVIFCTILVLLLTTETKEGKIEFFKRCAVMGIVAVVVLSPAYLILKKTSQYESFWVAAPTFSNIKQAFIDLTGKSLIFFYLSLVLLIAFVAVSIYHLLKKSEQFGKKGFNLFFLLLWLLLCSAAIIIKSYSGTSLILTRYFIGILPVLILINSLAIGYLKNKYLNYIFALLFASYSLYFIFVEKDYYKTVTKTQFSSATQGILDKKTNAPVFSSWGWLMSYYINSEKGAAPVTEITFEDYVTAVKNNAVKTEAFWYMDGNQRPINLTPENQQFLEENFNEVYSIEKFDVWAKYYEPIISMDSKNKSSEINLYNNDFKPLLIDGSGNLMIFENSEVKSATFNIGKGSYELIISANSLPLKKINNENAHLRVKINQQEIASFYLSENPANKETKIPFDIHENKMVKVSLIFDNDLEADGSDRNVVIYAVKIKNK